jgi:tetratricopeptide (TPR) repeat protein
LEALKFLEGEAGISRLARELKSEQPYGYLYWIQHLEACENWQGVRDACLEAMDALPHNSFREQVTESLIKAAMVLADKTLLLLGKRERLLSAPHQTHLLELLQEAENQNLRSEDLASKQIIRNRQDGYGSLYLEMLLMAGRLEDAFHEGNAAKSIGWSYGKAGILYSGILSMVTGNNPKAVMIQALLKEYAQNACDQIVKGLASASLTESKQKQYVKWADTICRERVQQIVSNQHRNAYGRAARALGAMAECYMHLNQKDTAISLLNEFVRTRFPRHSSFRAEVKQVVAGSGLLKGFKM